MCARLNRAGKNEGSTQDTGCVGKREEVGWKVGGLEGDRVGLAVESRHNIPQEVLEGRNGFRLPEHVVAVADEEIGVDG